jgi:hypothetical protein
MEKMTGAGAYFLKFRESPESLKSLSSSLMSICVHKEIESNENINALNATYRIRSISPLLQRSAALDQRVMQYVLNSTSST